MTPDLNERLTRVGKGTPAGELLRRYWMPVAAAAELTEDTPKLRVRIMGEDLVLFRDGEGRPGLVNEQCPHRSASLYYGFIEKDGIRCPYHGWKFDCSGTCIEQPFEPTEKSLKTEATTTAYPVQEFAGLFYAYLGPAPAPSLPKWDVLLREDGARVIEILPVLNCNWLQVMENSVDPCHTYYLHAHTLAMKGKAERAAYYYRPIEGLNFETVEKENWCGVIKQRTYGGEEGEQEAGHPVIFPNTLLSPQRDILMMHIRLPVDDTHTKVFRVQFKPNETGEPESQPEIPPLFVHPSFRGEDGEYHLDSFNSQDAMAWETQGAVTDRSRELLGHTDRGIALFRRLLRQQIDTVEKGGEPKGIIRDPALAERIEIQVSTGQARMAKQRAMAGSG